MVKENEHPASMTPVRFKGRGWDLMGIFASNAALTALTLGIYTFWAKVRTGKYLCEHTELFGSTFDYHATGQERFNGFLKASGYIIAFVAVMAGTYYGLKEVIPLFGGDPAYASWFVNITVVVTFGLLAPLLAVGRRRYKMARTSWRNVRFSYHGSTKEYCKMVFRSSLLAIVTLGLMWPALWWRIRKYNIEHTAFGSERFAFDGKLGDFYRIQAKNLVFWLALAVSLFIHHILFIAVLIAYLGYRSWIAAALHNYYWSHTSFMGKRFQGAMTGLDHFTTTWASAALIVLTLGVGFPFAYAMRMRLIADSTLVAEMPALDTIVASNDKGASSVYEGLSEASEAFDALSELL